MKLLYTVWVSSRKYWKTKCFVIGPLSKDVRMVDIHFCHSTKTKTKKNKKQYQILQFCWTKIAIMVKFSFHIQAKIFQVVFQFGRWILYKYILLVRVICEKYRLGGEANFPRHHSHIHKWNTIKAKQHKTMTKQKGVRVMVFNATFNNISVISWRQFYWWRKPEYSEKTTDLPQVTDKLYT